MRYLYSMVSVVAFCVSTNLQADVLVLVHGYLANPGSWEQSGINASLDAQGWKRGGLFSNSATGLQLFEVDNRKHGVRG